MCLDSSSDSMNEVQQQEHCSTLSVCSEVSQMGDSILSSGKSTGQKHLKKERMI